jgi:uncharacterized protein (TIGR02246 family)
MSSRPILLLAALPAGAASLHAQVPPGASAVLAAERRWTEALVKSDVAALEALYADDLVYVHSGGNVETKGQFLDRVRKGGLKYQKVELVDPRVRVFGSAAVVNGAFDVSVLVDGQPMNHRVIYTHVYAERNGGWRLVAHQTTRAPAP